VLTFGTLISRLYPINKRVKIDVYTRNGENIRDHLISVNYRHSTTFIEIEGGYSRSKQKMLSTICSYIELPQLINNIRKIDNDAFITVQLVSGVDGKMAVFRQGSE
jgi:uncharacterized membrane-anchored protein YitT (DUF2179 family)